MSEQELTAKVKALVPKFGSKIADGIEDWIESGKHDEIAEIATEYLEMEALAVSAPTAEEHKKWAREAALVAASIKTRIFRARVVAEDSLLDAVAEAIKVAAKGAAFVMKEVISVAVAGIAKGLASGATEVLGGDTAPK